MREMREKMEERKRGKRRDGVSHLERSLLSRNETRATNDVDCRATTQRERGRRLANFRVELAGNGRRAFPLRVFKAVASDADAGRCGAMRPRPPHWHGIGSRLQLTIFPIPV